LLLLYPLRPLSAHRSTALHSAMGTQGHLCMCMARLVACIHAARDVLESSTVWRQ
jgi:hypothetical protein